MTSSLTS